MESLLLTQREFFLRDYTYAKKLTKLFSMLFSFSDIQMFLPTPQVLQYLERGLIKI